MRTETKLTWLIVALILAVVLIGPFVVLWAVGTVFGTATPLTLKTWFAALCLMFLFGNPGAARSK